VSSSETKTRVKRRDGDRVRVQLDLIQQRPSDSTEEVDWEHAYKTLSYVIGRQMLSGDLLYLIAAAVVDKEGEKAARVFAECVSAQRDRFTHDFMG